MKFVWLACAALLCAGALIGFFVPMPYLLIAEACLLAAAGLAFGGICVPASRIGYRPSNGTEGQLRSILYNLEDAIIVYDKDFTITFFNPAAERLFGLVAAKTVGHASAPQDLEKEGWQFLTQVMFPSIAPTVVARTPSGEYPQVMDVSFTDPAYELRVSTLLMKEGDGRLNGFMKVVRDRTREVSLKREKGEFLTVTAHQLRTPVTEVLWAMETLARSPELRPSARSIVETAVHSARRLARMIEDLLNITRIEEGRFGYRFEAVDAIELIRNAIKDAGALARQLGIKVYFERPKSQLPMLVVDAQKFGLALANVIENAIRYNVENGQVTVKAEKIENRPFLEIQVRDTGIGISPDDLQKLFGKFFRSKEAMKAYIDGTGLGLYIARNIVQAHGGEIWADSEPGRGSIFHITAATDPAAVPNYGRVESVRQ